MEVKRKEVRMPLGDISLPGTLAMPENAKGIIIFADAGSRYRPGSSALAYMLEQASYAALLFDLLTEEEEPDEVDMETGVLVKRLIAVIDWLKSENETGGFHLGLLASGMGTAAALRVASELGMLIGAVVSRGGRADLAAPMLSSVISPTLLIVGRLDEEGVAFNEQAFAEMRAEREIHIIDGAGPLFEEEGKLDEVFHLALPWFEKYIVTEVREDT